MWMGTKPETRASPCPHVVLLDCLRSQRLGPHRVRGKPGEECQGRECWRGDGGAARHARARSIVEAPGPPIQKRDDIKQDPGSLGFPKVRAGGGLPFAMSFVLPSTMTKNSPRSRKAGMLWCPLLPGLSALESLRRDGSRLEMRWERKRGGGGVGNRCSRGLTTAETIVEGSVSSSQHGSQKLKRWRYAGGGGKKGNKGPLSIFAVSRVRVVVGEGGGFLPRQAGPSRGPLLLSALGAYLAHLSLVNVQH